MQEIWRDIEGYEGLYQVSNKRRVKSLNYRHTGKEEVLKQGKTKKGYLLVCLSKGGKHKNYQVHRLVASAFISNPENYPVINHLDENASNNCIENLEWCTQKYNCNYGTRNERLSKSKNRAFICVETGEVFSSAKEAQEKTGVFASAIRACARHEKWYHTAGGYHWEYIEEEEK